MLIDPISLAVPTANGNGASQYFPGGMATVYALGNAGAFDNGSLALQVSPDGGSTWFAVVDQSGVAIAFNGEGYRHFYLSGNPLLRIVLSGSNGNTTATVSVHYFIASTRVTGGKIPLAR